ncbi:hypothetical protein ABK040_005507 [Willaertia magna]
MSLARQRRSSGAERAKQGLTFPTFPNNNNDINTNSEISSSYYSFSPTSAPVNNNNNNPFPTSNPTTTTNNTLSSPSSQQQRHLSPSSSNNNNINAPTTTATFHHLSKSSENQKNPHKYHYLKGYPITVLVVVNGIRGQQISFMYPTDENYSKPSSSILDHSYEDENIKENLSPSTSSSSLNNNNLNNITNNNLSSSTTNPNNPSSSTVVDSNPSVTSSSNINSNNNNGTSSTLTTNQHLISHPQVLDRYENIFSLDSAALSYLLCPPKRSIIDKSMSMTIDQLLFLSRPASLNYNTVGRLKSNNSTGSITPPSNTLLNNSTISGGSGISASTNIKENNGINVIPSVATSGNGPVLCEQSNDIDSVNNNGDRNRIVSDYTHFTITFVFPSDLMNIKVESTFSHLLMILMKSYVREQIRCNYVTEQLNILGKLKDECKNWKELSIKSSDISLLAKELITVVDAIRNGTCLQLKINQWLEIGYKVPKRIHIRSHEEKLLRVCEVLNKYKSFNNNNTRWNEKLQPYHACIFVKDIPKLKIPPDGLQELQISESLLKMFNNPLKSITEISKELNLSINFSLLLVQHLVDWGVIRIIQKLHYSTILVLNDNNNIENIEDEDQCYCTGNDWFPPSEQAIHDFSKRFPTLPHLLEVLELFSEPRSCRAHLESISKCLQKSLQYHLENSPTTYYPTTGSNSDSSNILITAMKKKLSATTSTTTTSISTNNEQYMMCVIYLLRRGYIRICNTYYQLIIPHHNIQSKPNTSGIVRSTIQPMSPSTPPLNVLSFTPPHDFTITEFDDNSSTGSSPKNLNLNRKVLGIKIPTITETMLSTSTTNNNSYRALTVYELDYLKSICDDKYLLELLKKIYIYFNGEYSEKEILYQSNITREDFKRVLRAFQEVIISYTI